MESVFKQTRDLLRGSGLRPRKRLGQNFLVNAGVLDAIVEAAELSPEDVVLEIGAGTGTLTQRLALSSGKVIAVELDEGLFHILESIFQCRSNVTLIHGDILDLDLPAVISTGSQDAGLLEVRFPGVKIIGNLPYYITSPVLMKILDESSALCVRLVLVMIQEEVGARMVASPGTRDYGALSIAVAYRSDAQILRRVPASSFYPRPKVDSVLVRLDIRSTPPVDVRDERLFFQIVRSAFQYRRKTLRNALRLAFRSGEVQPSPELVNSALETLSLDPNRRGETLSISEFADLANMVRSLL